MGSDAVTTSQIDNVTFISIDDGKANALSPAVLEALNEALDRVDSGGDASRAVVLAGRTGMFSGGFDLKTMRGGDPAAIGSLVTAGGELFLRLYQSPRPVVSACTGHAIAAGALWLLASHFRVGADGPFKVGLVETSIGMVLPDWGVELAGARLTGRQLQLATIEAKVYDPAGALEAGFLDRLAPPDQILDVALEEARRLASFEPSAYAGNAAKVRGPAIAKIAAALAHDKASMLSPQNR